MKKLTWLLVAVMAICLTFAFGACVDNNNPTNSGDGTSSNTSESTQPETPPAPVINVTGVTEGQSVVYGTVITPEFDNGTATLTKDGAEAVEFVSGTEVSEIGNYVLTITAEPTVVTVNFSITLPDTTGQITDEFIGGKLNGAYYSNDGTYKIENGNLVINDSKDNQAWAIVKHKVEHVNVTEYPFIEVEILSLVNGHAEFKLSNKEYPGAEDYQVAYRFEVNGKYFVDAKAFVEANGLSVTDQELWVDLVVAGEGYNDGKMSVTFDYYKSVKEIPALGVANAWVDNTAETINQWIDDTANIEWFEGEDTACGVVTGSEGYGKAMKRVNLNTKAYPYLIVDVTEVTDAWTLKAFKFENYQLVNKEIVVAENKGAGKFEINLQKAFGVSENVDVLLHLYVIGKSEEKMFQFKGFETVAEPIYDIALSGINDGDIVNVSVKAPALTFDKGTATIAKDGGEAVEYISGTEITEVGSYVINVVAGQFSKTVSFTVIQKTATVGTIEDYSSASDFVTNDNGTLTFENGVFTFTKGAVDTMAKLEKRYDINFANGDVVVMQVKGINGYTPDAGFSIEILDDVNWVQVLLKADNTATFVEGENGVITIYWTLPFATKIATGETYIWHNELLNNLKVAIGIEYGDTEKAVQLISFGLTDAIPGVEEDANEVEFENFSSTDGFVCDAASGEGSEFGITDGDFYMTMQKDFGKFYKVIDLDFTKGNFVKFVFETAGYTPDTGFTLQLLDKTTWHHVLAKYPDFTYVTKATLANGRTQYTCYIDANTAAHTGTQPAISWTNAKLTGVEVTVIIEFGNGKTIYPVSLSYAKTLPAEANGNVVTSFNDIDAFTTENNATVEMVNGKFVYEKQTADSPAKLATRVNLDLTKGKYIALNVKGVNGYKPDAGFGIEFLDDVNWYAILVKQDTAAKVVDEADGSQTIYWEIDIATHTSGNGATVSCANKKLENIKMTVIIEYGNTLKAVMLNSLTVVSELPA